MLIERISHSRFWNETAIFIVEDDAQNGPDHVDAHRTEALVISPYTKHGFVDSDFYSTSSMVRTMELILGLPPLSQFDAAAQPMYNSFTSAPDPRPFAGPVSIWMNGTLRALTGRRKVEGWILPGKMRFLTLSLTKSFGDPCVVRMPQCLHQSEALSFASLLRWTTMIDRPFISRHRVRYMPPNHSTCISSATSQ